MDLSSELERYWLAVRGRICARCIDGDPTGRCLLSPHRECALEEHFPAVVNAILNADQGTIEPYVKSLREGVCAICGRQTENGDCLFRMQLDCGLDRHLPMIVETITEIYRKMGKP